MIDSYTLWATILILALGTFLIRVSVIAMSDRFEITETHREFFSYIPAAIIPAIVLPLVFYHPGKISWLANKERLMILILASAVCWWTRSMLITIAFGLITLYAVTQF